MVRNSLLIQAGLISPLLLGSHGSEDGLSGLGRQPSPSRQGEYGSSPSLKGLVTAGYELQQHYLSSTLESADSIALLIGFSQALHL